MYKYICVVTKAKHECLCYNLYVTLSALPLKPEANNYSASI